MSEISYIEGPSIADRFAHLLHNGLSHAEAIAILEHWCATHMRLPEEAVFTLDAIGNPVVTVAGGRRVDINTVRTPPGKHDPALTRPMEAPKEDDGGWLPAEIINIDDAKPQPAAPPPKPPGKPSRTRRPRLRHENWKKIRPYANRFVATNGPWPNPNAAAVEILAALEGLSISREAIYDGVKNHFPKWLVPDYKE